MEEVEFNMTGKIRNRRREKRVSNSLCFLGRIDSAGIFEGNPAKTPSPLTPAFLNSSRYNSEEYHNFPAWWKEYQEICLLFFQDYYPDTVIHLFYTWGFQVCSDSISSTIESLYIILMKKDSVGR